MSDISLRDHFAGLAMQAWVSAAAFNQEAEDMMKKAGKADANEMETFVACLAYSMADAMLKVRGADEAEEPFDRNDEITRDFLEMVSMNVPIETIGTWTDEQVRLAEEYASAVHLNASDNDDVVIPPRPAFLPKV
jgi:hypothetical protein